MNHFGSHCWTICLSAALCRFKPLKVDTPSQWCHSRCFYTQVGTIKWNVWKPASSVSCHSMIQQSMTHSVEFIFFSFVLSFIISNRSATLTCYHHVAKQADTVFIRVSVNALLMVPVQTNHRFTFIMEQTSLSELTSAIRCRKHGDWTTHVPPNLNYQLKQAKKLWTFGFVQVWFNTTQLSSQFL